ncbi:MAG: DNA translocase FtsK 4TM domain-containing protein [Patescibacteria group bacterium]|nr:DNA translocase FtsK 4TM domain-containing protein [Patescibacteria group bacterium]
MAGKRKNKKRVEELEYEEIEEEGVNIKTSIIAIIVFVLGLISLLGLFSLSGSFGMFLNKILLLGFGWAKWFLPVLLIVLSIALYRQRKFFPRTSNYIGLFLFFIFIPVIFHFFFKDSIAELSAEKGIGGGYLGFYLGLFLKNILGFWGGLIVVLAILIVGAILLFNITLSHLFGHKSFLYKTFKSAWGSLSSEEEEYQDELESNLVDYDERKLVDFAEEEEEDLTKDKEQGILFTKKEIGVVKKADSSFREDVPRKTEINWKTKKIKIDLPLELLSDKISKATSGDIENNILIIQRTLENFGIMVDMGQVNVGPTVTQYTFKPSEGIKVSRITALSNDLSLALAAHPIRIEAPIPGKSLIGIEVPNKTKAIVGLREILEDKDFKLRQSNLMAALGKDVSGRNIVYDIAKMPHLLVAGATNSGKSVCLNTIIVSLLYQNSPSDLRFIMVDPKRVELPIYNGIPHLLTPVITDVSKTINALRWCLNEMDRRYEVLNQSGKKNIQTYNFSNKEKIPYIMFIIDELADLMVAASKDIEGSVIRLTQMSRAVGIHLILATQRPSVDVITGLIKANTPSRVAFSVASAVDSKTILDSSGAEKLLGKGDMLFSTAELSKPRRIQGAYVDDSEILSIVNYIKDKYGSADYLEGIVDRQKVNGIGGVGLDGVMGDEDELLEEAKEIVVAAGKASTSFLQRRLRIGYSRAASILDMLEENGIVGPSNGSKPREIMISKEQYEDSVANSLSSVPIHDKGESKAPDNYLYPEDETTLVFEGDLEDEIEEEEEDIQENQEVEEGEELEGENDDINKDKEEEEGEEEEENRSKNSQKVIKDVDDFFGKFSSR